jgi:2-oxoglutarate ferredoxin oxidoreductase subunit delta
MSAAGEAAIPKTGGKSGAAERPRPAPRIDVDDELCKACGICIELCPQKVFDADGQGRPQVARLEDCTRCRFCEQHCPDFALEVLEDEPEDG